MIQQINNIYNSKIAFIYVFTILTLIQLFLYGAAIYFSSKVTNVYPYTSFGAVAILGNLFMVDAILSRNIYQVCVYPFLYVYMFLVTVLNIKYNTVPSFVCQMVLVAVVICHGLVFIAKISDLFYEFSWYYYKKIGGQQEIIGKFIF